MIALTTYQWTLFSVLIVLYLAICTRTAFRMAAAGRNFWLWLVITIFLTSIPATFLLMWEQFRAVRAKPRRGRSAGARPGRDRDMARCVHCGKVFDSREADDLDGVAACPHCGMVMDEAKLG